MCGYQISIRMNRWFTTLICHKLTLFTLLISFPLFCTQNTYYVKPTADTPCPGVPCHTLSQYGEQYFVNSSANVTLLFLPGDHTLNFTISVGTLPDDSKPDRYYPPFFLTLLGSSSSLPEITSRIVCTWPAGFLFSGITELHITALAFISCGHNDNAAINIWSVWNISITNCNFQNSTNGQSGSSEYGFGGAIHVCSSNLTLTENTFQHNFAHKGGALGIYTNNMVTLSRNIFLNNSANYGGGFYAHANNTLTLSENTFQKNNADDAGGALYADTNNTLTLSENIFEDNSADFGGVLLIDVQNKISLSENTFLKNTADQYGGALYASIGNTLILSKNTFQKNTADKGGALYVEVYNTLTFSENTFQNNTSDDDGGALYVNMNNILTFSENTFEENSADFGGTLFTGINNTISLLENTFQDNSADFGGAVFAGEYNTINLSKNTFQNNSADDGGALYAFTNNTLTLSGNTFQDNSAVFGGALLTSINNTINLSENIFQKNSADMAGGALCVYTINTFTISENSFQNNSADHDGGALYVHTNNTLTLSKNTFQDNSADFGGALLISVQNTISLSENTFLKNTADQYGGVLCTEIGNTLTISVNIFQNNTADQCGGALYVNTNNTLTLSENTFEDNSADFGGVYLIDVQNQISLSENTFLKNSADQYASIGNTLTRSENTFQNNTADDAGGALYVNTNNTLTLSENTFQNNTADDDGGALYVNTNNTVTFSENTFEENSADFGGVLFTGINNTISLLENTFQDNSADLGGALFAGDYNTINLLKNTFQNNSADNDGGALYAYTNNTLTLSGNTFQDNSAVFGGDLLMSINNTINLSGNIFQKNSADMAGGALCAYANNILTVSGNSFQNNSADHDGGALYVDTNNTLTLSKNTFQDNSADFGGALLTHVNNTINLLENTFQNNSADHDGGALYVYTNNTLTISGNKFQNNSADHDGGALFVYRNNILILLDNKFQNNLAAFIGGVLLVYRDNVLNISNNNFESNSAIISGGVLVVQQSIVLLMNNTLTRNTAESEGGAVFCLSNSTLQLNGSNRLQNNTAEYGGAISALGCKIVLAGDNIVENNTAEYGGGLYTKQSEFRGCAYFSKNYARRSGGGIYASRSDLYITQYITFVKNSAQNGGGLLLADDSELYLQPNTTIKFANNSVQQKGGAIKVEKGNALGHCIGEACEFLTGSDCFFQIQTERQYDFETIVTEITELHTIRMHFQNNTALEAGAMLYGGSVDSCRLSLINLRIELENFFEIYSCPNSGAVFDYITSVDGPSQDISSDPLYICSCKGGEPDCSKPYIIRSVYPGGTIEVPMIAYGQRNGATPAVVNMITPRVEIRVKETENIQNITKGCTTLNYTVQTLAVMEGNSYEMTLHVGPCPPKERTVPSEPSNVIKVHVLILQCPPGFELNEVEPSSVCNCAQRLKRFTETCRLTDRDISRDSESEFWVGYTQDNTSDGLILHPHCPFDYCTTNKMYIAVDDSDEQCSSNRTGLLCGKCAQNFSLALGTNRCLQCSNDYLWLTVAFAFAGVALVLLLLVLRLTVAAGTINGLIFYANIIAINSATFFSPHANVLTVFVAWLNLDLGIETCFYNGMDAYTKAWLQFMFPFYVWALVGIIILISHYSAKVATILGTNPIAVLATLFLLSYTKVLRAVIAALSYTLLEYPNNSNVAVWLYDGNVRYLSTKHILLFIGALVCLIVLFLPYTLFLIFSPWLRSKSGQYRIFYWVNHYRVIPFLDAYHAPYTDKHRYWTGLMLLVRCALFLLFALNALGDPSVNLLAIGSITSILPIIVYALFGNKIYKNWYLNMLELSFLVNLGILALATLYIRSTGGNQNAVTFTSVSVAFATFVGIVIYHSVQQIKHTPQLWRKIFPQDDTYELVPQTDSDPEGVHPPSPADPSDGTATVVHIDLRDLLENARNELREPCMEMDN